jgi:hypothetical protein
VRGDKAWAKSLAPAHSIITGKKTVIIRSENSFSGVYDTNQKNLFLNHDPTSQDFLSDPHQMDVTPSRTDHPKFYEIPDSVLSVHSEGQTPMEQQRIFLMEESIPSLILSKASMKLKEYSAEKQESLSPAQNAVLQERRRRLEFERKMLIKKTENNVRSFEEALEQLRVDRHSLLADLKLAELKLLVMFQEYEMLRTYEVKDIALQNRQTKCAGEKSEISGNMTEFKMKLEVKMEDLKGWNEKIVSISTDLKNVLPSSHFFADTLNKIFKKKIKRNKAGVDDDEEEEEEDDVDDDDDEDEEEVDDYCPAGCDRSLYDRIIELRERRLDNEEIIAEVQKSIDDLKKTIDRLKQREKQIVKDALQAEVEVQQFQLLKQATLNQIGIVVPLKISQLFAFHGSGGYTGPTDIVPPGTADGSNVGGQGLMSTGSVPDLEITDGQNELATLANVDTRTVVANINLHSHVLFNNKSMMRLQSRIGELHLETDEERLNLKEMYKERVRLNKDKEIRQTEIENWENKCKNIQMLKFGRLIDVDALEAGSDRSKEIEAEKTVKLVEDEGRLNMFRMQKELEEVKEKLSHTTLRNTDMLNMVASLTEAKLSITRELNSSKGPTVTEDSKQKEYREKEERKRMQMYLSLQAREIAALKAELTMLRRKDVPPLPTMMPQVPYQNQHQAPPLRGFTGENNDNLRGPYGYEGVNDASYSDGQDSKSQEPGLLEQGEEQGQLPPIMGITKKLSTTFNP